MSLHVMLSKVSAYFKSYDGCTNWMHFLIEGDDLLKKYNAVWYKVSVDIKKEFDSEPVYYKKFLETKIRSYGNEVTYFYDKVIPTMDLSAWIWLSRNMETIILKYV